MNILSISPTYWSSPQVCCPPLRVYIVSTGYEPKHGWNERWFDEDNYFVWEFNAGMKLAKKGLLEHIYATKAPSEVDAGAAI